MHKVPGMNTAHLENKEVWLPNGKWGCLINAFFSWGGWTVGRKSAPNTLRGLKANSCKYIHGEACQDSDLPQNVMCSTLFTESVAFMVACKFIWLSYLHHSIPALIRDCGPVSMATLGDKAPKCITASNWAIGCACCLQLMIEPCEPFFVLRGWKSYEILTLLNMFFLLALREKRKLETETFEDTCSIETCWDVQR